MTKKTLSQNYGLIHLKLYFKGSLNKEEDIEDSALISLETLYFRREVIKCSPNFLKIH